MNFGINISKVSKERCVPESGKNGGGRRKVKSLVRLRSRF